MTLNQQAIALLRQIARMETESEIYDKNGEGMSGDDAVDTVSGLIRSSRELIAKIDKEAKEQTKLKKYALAGIAGYYDNDSDGGIDFDDEEFVTVSKGDDPGAYVSCWAWVSDEDVKQWRKDQRRNAKN